MRSEFGEIQFCFGYLNDATRLPWILSPGEIPFLPTQPAEKDLGYDVRLSGRYGLTFLQFKVVEELGWRGTEWPLFYDDYYRFPIYKRHPQHNLLVQLAQQEPLTFYCVPAFHTLHEYHNYFQKAQIAQQSVCIPCRHLPRIHSTEEHKLAFTRHPRRVVWSSDPQEIDCPLVLGMDELESYARQAVNEEMTLGAIVQRLVNVGRALGMLEVNIPPPENLNQRIVAVVRFLYNQGILTGILKLDETNHEKQ